jgi:hypothetical protein
MPTGAEYLQQFIAMFDPKVEGQPAREEAILKAYETGNVPAYMARSRWKPVIVSGLIGGKKRTLQYDVSPWMEVGTEPGLIIPMQPATLQTLADRFKALIPSTKIVLDAFLQADVRIPLQTPGAPFIIPGPPSTIAPPAADMQTPQAFGAHDALVKKALLGRSPGDHLIAGHSKNVVVGPNRSASQLAIYGGWSGLSAPDPTKFVDGWFWQPYPGPHPSTWVDYSQCSFLVGRDAQLDGMPVDLATIFIDSTLHPLVSTQGPFTPRFPNAGLTGASNIGGSGTPGVYPPAASAGRADFGWKDAAFAAAMIGGVYLVGWGLFAWNALPSRGAWR